MIQYRRFRNQDPPALAEIWNAAMSQRGAYPLRNAALLERYLFCKPYFHPDALTIAVVNRHPVGFSLAGFAANEAETGLNRRIGVTCFIVVHPSYQEQGIGSELLFRAEGYLLHHGARLLYAGGLAPHSPYGFGLYGGSNSPGFLNSDFAAAPFLESHGYLGLSTTLVFQRQLHTPINVVDNRFGHLRRNLELQSLLFGPLGSWWQQCVMSWVEPREFRLVERRTNIPVARCLVWEMEGYNSRWNAVPVGILDVQVRPDRQGHGVGKFLIAQTLKTLQEEFVGLVETQVPERNAAAVSLFRSLGFQTVDVGRTYRKDDSGDTVPIENLRG